MNSLPRIIAIQKCLSIKDVIFMTERYQQNCGKLNHYIFENFSNLLEDPYYSLEFIPTQNRLMFDITCNSLHFQYSLHTLHLFLHIQISDKTSHMYVIRVHVIQQFNA